MLLVRVSDVLGGWSLGVEDGLRLSLCRHTGLTRDAVQACAQLLLLHAMVETI